MLVIRSRLERDARVGFLAPLMDVTLGLHDKTCIFHRGQSRGFEHGLRESLLPSGSSEGVQG